MNKIFTRTVRYEVMNEAINLNSRIPMSNNMTTDPNIKATRRDFLQIRTTDGLLNAPLILRLLIAIFPKR